MKNIQMNYSNLNVEVNLQNKVTLLWDNSGTGKTFLFSILVSYFQENNIPFSLFDYKSSERDILSILKQKTPKDYLLFDNADLFMTNEIWDEIKSNSAYSIISIKSFEDYSLEGVGICIVDFNESTLKLEDLT